jgi:hypothetical protein
VKDFRLEKCLYVARGSAIQAQSGELSQISQIPEYELNLHQTIGWASAFIRGQLRRKKRGPEVEANMAHDARFVSHSLITNALRIKHPGFAEEREWRLIDNARMEPQFRHGTFGVTPYLVATLPAHWKKAPLGIAEVIVGPTPNPEATLTSIRDLLLAQCRSKARVTSCEIPYRAW